jgi:very-short-patch-repair endonuclease
MKVFNGEKMITQYKVIGYRIDLYFLDYKLAIECDENSHNDRNPDEETIGQNAITKKLKCE